MTIHIPKQYLWYGGIAAALGLAYWYLKANGIWDSWFNSQGQLVPAPPVQPSGGGGQGVGFTFPAAQVQPRAPGVN